ncbi:MAG: methyltransferase [Clostridia bacterium]|nr:methyltransferase [Clostridia bacterium]
MTTLLPNEKIEDLLCGGLKIIQSKTLYRFTSDAVILANCLGAVAQKVVCEVGTGSGVISILATKKFSPKKIVAVEVQPSLSDMCLRSVKMNGLDDVIDVVCQDVVQFAKRCPNTFDVVFCNPPYRKVGAPKKEQSMQICKEEILLTLPSLAQAVSLLLKDKGSYVGCYPWERLDEFIATFKAVGLGVTKVLPICATQSKPTRLAIVWATKGSKLPVEFLPCLVEREGGKESAQMKKLIETQQL